MRVTVQADWKGYNIQLDTTLEKLVAKYIFAQDDYQDDGRDITNALSKAFKANFDRVYENPTKISFMCAPSNEQPIRNAFKAFITEFQTTGNLPPERAQEICDALTTLPAAPKSTPASPKP